MSSARPASPGARLRQTFQRLGVFEGSLYLCDRAARRLTGGRARLIRYLIVAQPLGRAATIALRAGGATRVEPAGPTSPYAAAFPRPPGVIAARFASGASCIVATVKDQFAGFLWWQRNRYEEDEVRCSFVLADASASVWDFDVYVEPRYRLGRTMLHLWQEAERRLVNEGVRWSFSRIAATNIDSLASHSRLGAVRTASATFLRVGRVQLSVFDCRPFVHLSLSPDSPPILRLRPPAPPSSGA